MKNMLVPCEPFTQPDFTIYNVGFTPLSQVNVPLELRDPSLGDTLIGLNFDDSSMVIYGTMYAGEMKKGILTYMMYLAPLNNHLPLHSSANKGDNGVSLFFGLSGTGKTTLALATAKENGSEIFELNSSDLRNRVKL